MEKEFLGYEESLKLKELGFDEACFAQYGMTGKGIGFEIWNDEDYEEWRHEVNAPTFSQAFRFFREKYDLFISIVHYENGYSINDLRRFKTYEEAELACLHRLIEIAQNKIT